MQRTAALLASSRGGASASPSSSGAGGSTPRRLGTMFVNGQKHSFALPRKGRHRDPEHGSVVGGAGHGTLADFLRRQLGLKGTKVACGEGGCGACTVAVTARRRRVAGDAGENEFQTRAVNSCLVPLASMDGAHVTTVEGIGNSKDPHPVQERVAGMGGSQCGFCTPGFVMSMYSSLADSHTSGHGTPTASQIIKALDGNLCRCTAYRPLLDAAKSFASDIDPAEHGMDVAQLGSFAPFDPAKHLPSEEFAKATLGSTEVDFGVPLQLDGEGESPSWFAPHATQEVLQILRDFPKARLVTGATELSIEGRFQGKEFPIFVSVSKVEDEMATLSLDDNGKVLTIGSAVLLTDLWQFIEEKCRGSDSARAIAEQLQWFSGTPVRNVASIGGNVVNASPISDLAPVFLALNATYVLQHMGDSGSIETRRVGANDFCTGYRQTVMRPGEAMVAIELPIDTPDSVTIEAYKQSRRREDDIAIVTACLRADTKGGVFSGVSLAYGGVAATTIRAKDTEAFLEGRPVDRATMDEACTRLAGEIGANLSKNSPGGMPEYRATLAASLLKKFILRAALNHGAGWVDDAERSAATTKLYHDESSLPMGKQVYSFSNASDDGAIHKNEMVMSAEKQATGEATYIDDIPLMEGELFAYPVTSTHARARIVEIDTSAALQIPGVKRVLTHRDIPGSQLWGDIFVDEPILAPIGEADGVTCYGQSVAVVVADSPIVAREAARALRVEYEKGASPVLTIDDAIAQGSFYDVVHELHSGNLEAGFADADVIVEGSLNIGGQEHFYFETNAAIAYPEEGDMRIQTSTQNANKTQKMVSSMLGIPIHKVVAQAQRIGGGFGGKETRSIGYACLAALAAHHEQKPVRVVLERDTDMQATGGRHPFKATYRVGAKRDGKLVAADLGLYSKGGNSQDLSVPIIDRAILFTDGCFKIPNFSCVGKICKTDTPSNTAFRGFGGPQGEMVSHAFIDHVARELKLAPEEVRDRNLYEEGDLTPYGFPVPKKLRTSWNAVLEQSNFDTTRAEVADFNKQHTHRKRGFAALPAKFGIGFTAQFLNQGTALLHVYTDGSVLVSHGGVEMGQGLHTKVAQVVAHELGIPVSKVHTRITSTDKVANASATAASMGSDIYCAAALDAAQQVSKRLAPFREKLAADASLADLAHAAYFAKVNLSAQGWFKSSHPGYDFNTHEGAPWRYFTMGAVATLVEVDCLTGDHKVLRSDIVMDVGQSLNPQVDIGQIEGAFLQGQGWMTLEELKWADEENPWGKPDGRLLTNGPGAYKIPAGDDIPTEWNITLLDSQIDEKREITPVHSAKAVGEPPFLLGMSVYDAIKEAIYAHREQNGSADYFQVDSPLTSERIRMSCTDSITEAAKKTIRE